MTINLSKGQRETLQTTQFTVGLGWQESTSGEDFDLDASVFILGKNNKLLSDDFFVFYNNLVSPDGAVEHTGDNRTGGDGSNDEESIIINLSSINHEVTELCIVVTIHEAKQRQQNFGQVRNSYIRIIDNNNGKELMKFELDEDFSVETGVEFGRIYKRNNEWRFEASGIGTKNSLEDYVNKYK